MASVKHIEVSYRPGFVDVYLRDDGDDSGMLLTSYSWTRERDAIEMAEYYGGLYSCKVVIEKL